MYCLLIKQYSLHLDILSFSSLIQKASNYAKQCPQKAISAKEQATKIQQQKTQGFSQFKHIIKSIKINSKIFIKQNIIFTGFSQQNKRISDGKEGIIAKNILFKIKNCQIIQRRMKQSNQKSGKYKNEIQQYSKRTQRVSNNYIQVKQNCQKERVQMMDIKRQIDVVQNKKNLVKLNIKSVKHDNSEIKRSAKYLHNEIRSDTQTANEIKHQLRSSQKKLKNEMMVRQQLANSKASILLSANSIVMLHKK